MAWGPQWAFQSLTSALPPMLTTSSHTKCFPPAQPARRKQAISLFRPVAKCTQQNAFKPSRDKRLGYKNHINPQVFLSRAWPQLSVPALTMVHLPFPQGMGDVRWGHGELRACVCLPMCVMVGSSVGTRPISDMATVGRALFSQ